MTRTNHDPSGERTDRPVTERIAEDVLAADFDRHPDRHVEHARRAVVDALGNGLLARETPLGRGYLDSTASTDDGTTVVGGGRASPVDAAFANAGLLNALDWDDTIEGGGHPGASIIPTALAVGEREDATIPELLNALVVGYEVSVRVALALQPSWERYDVVHGSGTRHAIGSAAAAAALLDRDLESTQELLGLAAMLAPVPHAVKFGWEEKRLTWLKDNNARAASAAVRAAMSLDGFTGPRKVLDGEGGFWRMAGSDRCDWEVLGQPLGDPYMIDRVSFKPYPCCRWLHSAVEAASRAATEVGELESVRVETADRVVENFMLDPINQVNAEFSLPFAVGQAAAGKDEFEWYDEDGPSPLPSFEVDAVEGPEHSRRFSEERVISASATATDVSGETATVAVDRPLGTSERPLPEEVSYEKLVRGVRRSGDDPDSRADDVVELLSSDEPVSALLERLELR